MKPGALMQNEAVFTMTAVPSKMKNAEGRGLCWKKDRKTMKYHAGNYRE
jgi:hypothetical protein